MIDVDKAISICQIYLHPLSYAVVCVNAKHICIDQVSQSADTIHYSLALFRLVWVLFRLGCNFEANAIN